MDDQVSKALFLGIALVLFILAFTTFLEYYRSSEEYMLSTMQSVSRDLLYQKEAENNEGTVTGAEVLHLILEKKRQEQEKLLSELYTSGSMRSSWLPDIKVDGKGYDVCSLSSINPGESYQIAWHHDTAGTITLMEFSKGR